MKVIVESEKIDASFALLNHPNYIEVIRLYDLGYLLNVSAIDFFKDFDEPFIIRFPKNDPQTTIEEHFNSLFFLFLHSKYFLIEENPLLYIPNEFKKEQLNKLNSLFIDQGYHHVKYIKTTGQEAHIISPVLAPISGRPNEYLTRKWSGEIKEVLPNNYLYLRNQDFSKWLNKINNLSITDPFIELILREFNALSKEKDILQKKQLWYINQLNNHKIYLSLFKEKYNNPKSVHYHINKNNIIVRGLMKIPFLKKIGKVVATRIINFIAQ